MRTNIILLLMALGLTSGARSQVNNKTYTIQSFIGGKYLDVQWAKDLNGTPLHLWPYNGKVAQRFTFEEAGNGYFYIKSDLGKYLHVEGASKKPKTRVVIWQGMGADNTKWKFIDAGNGYKYIQSKLGNNLDVQWASDEDGTPIWTWSPNQGNAQKWRLFEASDEPKNNVKTLNVDEEGRILVSISITGVRGTFHDEDCNKISGKSLISVYESDNCLKSIKPQVPTAIWFQLFDESGVSYINDVKHKKIAKLGSINDENPNNIKTKEGTTFFVNYSVEKSLLDKGIYVVFKGLYKGCHKSGDFDRNFHCNLVYRGSLRIKVTSNDLKKGTISKKAILHSSDGQTHELVFYVSIINPLKII